MSSNEKVKFQVERDLITSCSTKIARIFGCVQCTVYFIDYFH